MKTYSNFLSHFSNFLFKKKLKHLILHVTNHCNFRCSHCFVDFINVKKDLKIEDYQNISKNINNLFWLDVGGGEPFLRKDLSKIINLFKKQIVSIPTNGWLLENIIEQIDLIEKKNSELVINLSLDGLENTHNKIRKNEKSWEKVWTCFEVLKKIKKIKTRIITVIHKENYNEIIPLMEIVKKNRADFHSVILLRGNPLDPNTLLPNMDELLKISPQIFNILEDYKYGQNSLTAHFLKNYHRYMWKTSLKTIEKQKQIVPCLSGQSSLVIWGNGDVSSCEELKPIGNIKNKKISEILKSYEFNNQVKSIKNKECHCTHNCAMLNSIFFNPKTWPNMIYQKKP